MSSNDLEEELEEMGDPDEEMDYIDEERISDGRLGIGISVVDNYLNGLPKGSTIAMIGSTSTPIERFLTQLTNVRKTEYITTNKPNQLVSNLAYKTSSRYESERRTPNHLTIYDYLTDTDDTFDFVTEIVEEIDYEQQIVIDNYSNILTNIEDSQDKYKLTREIQEKTAEQNGLTFLYFTAESYNDLSNEEKQTLSICDGVFNLISEKGTQKIQSELSIFRMRGIGTLNRSVFRLKTTSGRIIADSSEDIS